MLETLATASPVIAPDFVGIDWWMRAQFGGRLFAEVISDGASVSNSEIVLLSARPCVLIHVPFRIPTLAFERPTPDLK